MQKTNIEMQVENLKEQVEELEKTLLSLKIMMGKIKFGKKNPIPEECIPAIVLILNEKCDFTYELVGKENIIGSSNWNNDMVYGNISTILDDEFPDDWKWDDATRSLSLGSFESWEFDKDGNDNEVDSVH